MNWIDLGAVEEFHLWIYALAGGMFVSIRFADMVDQSFHFIFLNIESFVLYRYPNWFRWVMR